jgi:flagellar motor switch protein FliN
MALITEIPISEAAAAAARALEELLGHGVALATGAPVPGARADEIAPDGARRAVMLPFTDGITGDVTLVVDEHLGAALEAVSPDGSLTSAALPALLAAADEIARTTEVGVDPDDADVIAAENLATVVGDSAGVPLFEEDAAVACIVVRIVDDAASSSSFTGPVGFEPAAPVAPALMQVGAANEEHDHDEVARHDVESPAKADATHAGVRPIALLNDVAMDVTAQLGRRRLKVRDIVTLQPGSVLQLDRAAGSPVDVLVNGALVWRGEVVVVDDDLSVRVSEVVVDESASAPRPR